MTGLAPAFAAFDLGEYVGIGLDTNQIGYLAGSLFLGLFGLSALRHARAASGVFPVVWIAVSIGLIAGALLLAARGFPDELPEWLRPWTEPHRLTRAAAVAILLGCAAVLLSAHLVSRPTARIVSRVAGFATAGAAFWLAAGWFADQVPFEMREWTGQTTVMRGVLLAGLALLAAAFWVRPQSSPHARWLSRALAPPALAMGAVLASRWFGTRIWPDLQVSEVQYVSVTLGAVATCTCLLIAGGAYLVRERPAPFAKPVDRALPVIAPAGPRQPTSARALPVALLLDEQGRPIVPARPGPTSQAGPAGA